MKAVEWGRGFRFAGTGAEEETVGFGEELGDGDRRGTGWARGADLRWCNGVWLEAGGCGFCDFRWDHFVVAR